MQGDESDGAIAGERVAALRAVQARRQELLQALRALDEEDRRLRLGEGRETEGRETEGERRREGGDDGKRKQETQEADCGEAGGGKRSGGVESASGAESNARSPAADGPAIGAAQGENGGNRDDGGLPKGGAELEGAGTEAAGGVGEGGRSFEAEHALSAREVQRYSRQLMLPSFGVAAQQRLRRGSVLVVGAGGLGSPAALYLAACGVGACGGAMGGAVRVVRAVGQGEWGDRRIGIVDRDDVELSNLHRQIIHSEVAVGRPKTESAAAACTRLNSDITVETHSHGFTPANAVHLVSSYDVLLDASDNVATRYLASDAAVAARKPLVSGAALGTEGQITVYGASPTAPCYRCLFPSPPPTSACQRCSDSGVLGAALMCMPLCAPLCLPCLLRVSLRIFSPHLFILMASLLLPCTSHLPAPLLSPARARMAVPGVIGVLQAVEALKVVAGVGAPLSARMLVYDALAASFLNVKLRSRVASCVACGEGATMTADSISAFDYQAFTSSPFHDQGPKSLSLIPPSQRVPPTALLAARQQRRPHVLLDVRPPHLFSIAHLPGAINTPLATLPAALDEIKLAAQAAATSASSTASQQAPAAACEQAAAAEEQQGGGCGGEGEGGVEAAVFVVCRRGNDSQRAVGVLREAGVGSAVSVDGGMLAWGAHIDPSFPAF
ncbi:unnamed protein product [Closterium sp. NIES-64]|nr:unnamed protein product [Closterium sp. NIES-64]